MSASPLASPGRPFFGRCGAAALAALLVAACGDAAAPENASDAQAAPAPRPAAPARAAPPPQPASGPMSNSGYELNGAEPFWGGTVTGTTVRYMVPEDQFGDLIETRLALEPGREVYRGEYRGRPFVLTLSRGPCSNGMSDHRYAFAAMLEVRGETRRGCADPQQP